MFGAKKDEAMKDRNYDPQIVAIRNDVTLDREQKIDAIIDVLFRKDRKVADHLAPKDPNGGPVAILRIGPNGEQQLVTLEPEAARMAIARAYLV
jgi:hypothetical protein